MTHIDLFLCKTVILANAIVKEILPCQIEVLTYFCLLSKLINFYIFKYNEDTVDVRFLSCLCMKNLDIDFTFFEISGGFLLNSSENIDISVNSYSSWTYCRISWIRSSGNISAFIILRFFEDYFHKQL